MEENARGSTNWSVRHVFASKTPRGPARGSGATIAGDGEKGARKGPHPYYDYEMVSQEANRIRIWRNCGISFEEASRRF